MAWLVREGEVLATLEVAANGHARRMGLLGRDGIEGAFLLRPCRSVHTLGMRFPIDVAFCAPTVRGGPDLQVLATVTMGRHRLGRPRLRANCVIEAEAGAFERWRLRPGDVVQVKG